MISGFRQTENPFKQGFKVFLKTGLTIVAQHIPSHSDQGPHKGPHGEEMASGKKNYFRHSFFASDDEKIVTLISKHGKAAYFHYFRLLELCGQKSESYVPDKFVFHVRTLCAQLMVD